MVAAAALHVLAFFGLPTWRGAFRSFDTEPWQGVIEWVVLSFPSAGTAEAVGPDAGGDGAGGEIDVGADPGRDVWGARLCGMYAANGIAGEPRTVRTTA